MDKSYFLGASAKERVFYAVNLTSIYDDSLTFFPPRKFIYISILNAISYRIV